MDDRAIWDSVVLSPLAEAGRRRVSNRNRAGAIPYAEAVESFGGDSEQILKVTKPALAWLRDNGRSVLKEIKQERDGTPLTTTVAAGWAANVESAFTPMHELIQLMDEDDSVEYAGTLDEAAGVLLSLGIAVSNDLKEYSLSLDLVQKAIALAKSEDLQTKLAGDLRQANENAFQWAMTTAFEFAKNEKWIDAATTIDYAEKVARTDEERNAVSSARAALSARGTRREREPVPVFWIVVAIFIVITIVGALANAFSGAGGNQQSSNPVPGSKPSPTLVPRSQPPPPGSTPSPVPSSERSRLGTQITANKSRLSSLESQVNKIDAELVLLESQIEAIQARYPSLRLPEPYYSQHNNLVSQYNSLLKTRGSLVSEYDSLVDSTNALVAAYNKIR